MIQWIFFFAKKLQRKFRKEKIKLYTLIMEFSLFQNKEGIQSLECSFENGIEFIGIFFPKGFQNIFQVRKTKETSGGNILTREKDEEVKRDFRGGIQKGIQRKYLFETGFRI